MARITIKDLPGDKKISRKEMKKLFGGAVSGYKIHPSTTYYMGSDPFVINDPSPGVPPYLAELFGDKRH